MAKESPKVETTKQEQVSLLDLKFSHNENWRNTGNMEVDLGINSMVEDILRAGKIHTPLLINGETKEVLRGFRRGTAGLQIINDPKSPQDVIANLKKVQVIAYYGLDAKREMELRYDDGGFKPLSKSEIIRAFFRFIDKMTNMDTIYGIMYQSLARYTGKTEKIAKVETLRGLDRQKYLREWFKGTCEQYFRYAYELGEKGQQCLILSELAKERELTETEQATLKAGCRLDRPRVTELYKILGEKGHTGVAEKMEEFRKIDSGEITTPEPLKRLTDAEIKTRINGFSSDTLKTAMGAVIGGDESIKARDKMKQLDHDMSLLEQGQAILSKGLDGLKKKNPEAYAIGLAFLHPTKENMDAMKEVCPAPVSAKKAG